MGICIWKSVTEITFIYIKLYNSGPQSEMRQNLEIPQVDQEVDKTSKLKMDRSAGTSKAKKFLKKLHKKMIS